jgi:hypothetical protein
MRNPGFVCAARAPHRGDKAATNPAAGEMWLLRRKFWNRPKAPVSFDSSELLRRAHLCCQ